MDTINSRQVDGAGIVSENEVIGRILLGEKDLFSVIIRRYNQRLYRIGMAIINDDAEAEDAMQVAYIHAWENLQKFAFRSSFSTWLTRIMINECLLRVRTRKKVRAMKDEIKNHHGRVSEESAASKLLRDELKKVMESAISELPEKYRTVFIMREVENMNVSDTKECLAISEENVKVRLNRAKAMLRQSLSNLYNSDNIFDYHLSRCNNMVEIVMGQILIHG